MKPIYAGDRIVQQQKNSLFVNLTETASKMLELKKGDLLQMYVYENALMMIRPKDIIEEEFETRRGDSEDEIRLNNSK
jgi:hypothetical protein